MVHPTFAGMLGVWTDIQYQKMPSRVANPARTTTVAMVKALRPSLPRTLVTASLNEDHGRPW